MSLAEKRSMIISGPRIASLLRRTCTTVNLHALFPGRDDDNMDPCLSCDNLGSCLDNVRHHQISVRLVLSYDRRTTIFSLEYLFHAF